jgi:hypothetical protein
MDEHARAQLTQLVADCAATRNDVAWLKDAIKGPSTRLDKIEERTRTLEIRQAWYAGAATVIATFAGIASKKLGWS